MSQLVTDRINNEVKGLEQSLRLMQAQKTVQEALSQLAEARRNIGMSRAGFSVQLAASPEARLQAEERRSELARQQEQERISERRALLGTERQMLQMQLQIQLRQQHLQQEQLKIQKAEIEIQRFKAEQAAREVASKLVGLNPNSTEYKALRAQWTLIGKELQLRDQQLQVMRRTQELAVEQEGVIRQTTELEGQRLDIQGQALGVQVEMANLTHEQQQTMARLQAEEQQITNALEQQLNAKRELQRENEESLRTLQNEMRAAEELQKLEQSRMELTKARADAQVDAAERELRVAQAQANASAPGSSTRGVISAQIEALAAGQRGMVSEADATRRLYQAKQKQLEAEQTMRREQQRFQQERERSELRIYEMQLRAQLLSAKQTALQIKAQESQLRLQQERDRLSGAPAAPVLPPPPGSQSDAVRGGGVQRLPGSITGRHDASGENGGDMPVGPNNEIVSYHNGVVKELNRAGNNGNYIVIDFIDDLGNQLEATYSHIAASVRKGDRVIGGQVIGRFDGSGRTFGAHNSVDINSLGHNGSLKRSQETPAARRAADLLIQGHVLGSAAPALQAVAANSTINRGVKEAFGLSDEEIAAAVNTAFGEYKGPDPRGRTDVFANILARSRSSQYPSNLVDVVTQSGQYAPNFGRSRSQVTNPNLYGRAVFDQVKAELMDAQMLSQSIRDVDSRLYFKGTEEQNNMVRGVDFLRAPDQNFFHGPGRTDPGRNPQITAQLLQELGGAGTPGLASSTENTAQRLANEAAANNNLLKDLKDLLDRLTNELIPNLDQIQRNQGDALAQANAAQRQAMEVERIRAQITAEVLATSQGRLAAELSDGITAGITGPIRGVFSQLFRGEMNFAQMSEELSIQMAERVTGAFLNAALAPIEEQLKSGLFKAISGVDLEAEVAKAQQEAAQNLEEAGTSLKEAADSLKSVGTVSPAAQTTSSIEPGMEGLSPALQAGSNPSTDLDTEEIKKKGLEAGNKLEKLGKDAEKASDSTKDFMAGAGKAMVALGGLAMAAGGVQQMGKGGTYNTLMGLASIFGGIASVTGAFARARGGPVTANTPYLVGEEGPELFVPNQDGEVNSTSRTQALLAARSALGGNQMAGSADSQDGMGGSSATGTALDTASAALRSSSATGTALQMSNAAVRAQQQLLRERSSERTFQEVVNRPSGPLDINFQSEVINNVEYVTADQFQRGMSDAANRGRALTLQVLGSSVQTRRKLGMS
jgi:murein DD-endopeptidase MepM/ murein hydrolase activator NlpD